MSTGVCPRQVLIRRRNEERLRPVRRRRAHNEVLETLEGFIRERR